MKIAIWHNLPSGGGKRALYHHVKGLLERGHTLESWCPPTADQSYLPLNELIKENIVPLAQLPMKRRSKFIKQPFSPYFHALNSIQAMDAHCQQCAAEINCGGFDVLFANACTFFRTTAIGRYVKVPTAIYLQEPNRELYEAMPSLPWAAIPPPAKAWWSSSYVSAFLKNLIQVQGYRLQVREELQNARAFDVVLVNSLFSRESVLRAYGLDAKVCYLGIDTELFKPSQVPRKKIVVGLGGIYSGKGLERAVRAIGTIQKEKRPDLIWIGNFSVNSYQQKIEQLARSLEVNFMAKVQLADDEIVKLLSQAAVMIYTPVLEPFGFAPLEANACETPVVAIAEGGIRESIKDGINGFLINGDEPILIGKAISSLLDNPDIVEKMGERARKYVLENWSWKQANDCLENYLLSLIVKR
ncbi:MAG: D-inositol-3-phosphate glycosyltransferase [Chroococcidiopsis sp. SAG 2025]|uniref:glycosyltransferase family 4 protein n=1 Tax=Chroococcidiopsis sp. SAG 2025 TaxID=171389 RepID=UPI0029370205|nr:glycosyltransferase family 4 protein [Chroococcidiopsis sp. SAG 2025]MDV2993625.1 D-inositol-3-phosphate glycosyltransferase [Chroococcidiopsis sp. SAG 2025]